MSQQVPDEKNNNSSSTSMNSVDTSDDINNDNCSSTNSSIKNKAIKRKLTKKEALIMSSEEATRDQSCLNTKFPSELEIELLCSIFAIGLKESSPKILLDLMPKDSGLSNEHIKSHLQKYRIHSERSQQEFLQYWGDHMSDTFHEWEKSRGWEDHIQVIQRTGSNQDSSRQNIYPNMDSKT
jgi:SHAQKYF class myb-like DNA-binding protein